MKLNKKGVFPILGIFILFSAYSVFAATGAKKDMREVPVKDKTRIFTIKAEPPVTRQKKHLRLTPVTKDSPVFPDKKSGKPAPIQKRQSYTQPEQPKIKAQQNMELNKKYVKGFCCINGLVQNKQTTSRECSSRKGSWHRSQTEAKNQCRLLSGYCIVKNNIILPTSQKRCDSLGGEYFVNRSTAQAAVMKNREESAHKPIARLERTRVQDGTLPRVPKSILQTTRNPVRSAGAVSPKSLPEPGEKRFVSEFYLPKKTTVIRDPFLDHHEYGMFDPFVEDLRTPLPEGVDPGKLPNWGNGGGDPGRDRLAGRAERIWDDPNSGWVDYLYAAYLWIHADNDIDQRSGTTPDGGSSSGVHSGGGGSGGSSGGNDDDTADNDDDDESDDGSDDQNDDQDTETASNDDESTDDDQGEDNGTSEEGYQADADRGGRGGNGPSLGAQLSQSISIDLSTGRKKHEKLTGGGRRGGHVSTPLTQPGKGDEHQTDVPDLQITHEDDTSQGTGIGPVVRHETPYPPGVGPNAQPSVDYEDSGPLRTRNNGNPIRLPDWITDDPRVHN